MPDSRFMASGFREDPGSQSAAPPDIAHGARVLLVSNDAARIKAISTQFLPLGHQLVAVTAEVKRAVTLAAEGLADLVLIDIDGPQSASRLSTCRYLRDHHPCALALLCADPKAAALHKVPLARPHAMVSWPMPAPLLDATLRVALDAAKLCAAPLPAPDPDRDAVTGLPNLSGLHKQFEIAISRALRTGTRFAFGAIELEPVTRSDASSAEVTKAIVIEAVARLHATLRRTDVIASIDGRQLAFLAEDVDAASLDAIGRRLMRAFVAPLEWRGHPLRVTSSVGLSLWRSNDDKVETLLQAAQAALQEAKRHGGSQWRVDPQARRVTQVVEAVEVSAPPLHASVAGLLRRSLGWASLATLAWLVATHIELPAWLPPLARLVAHR